MPLPEVTKLDKSKLEESKGINPMDFLKGASEEEVITQPKKEEEKQAPAKELKTQYEKVKKEKEQLEKEKQDALDRIKELESKVGDVSELEPLRPVADYLKKKAGKLDTETVEKELIEKNKLRKKQIEEKEKALQNKDLTIKELSIEHSEEWQNDYVKPINEANNLIVSAIVNIDSEGKIRHPELMQSLFSRVVQPNADGTTKSSTQIKQEIVKFSAEYEKATGLEYDTPLLRDVVDAVSTYHKKIENASKAKADWNKVTEDKRKEKLYNESQQREVQIKKELQGREFQFSTYKKSLDLKEIEEAIGDTDIFIKAVDEEHQYLANALSGKVEKSRDYNEFIDLAAKGKVYPNLIAKIKELQDEISQLKKDEKTPPFRGGARKEDGKSEQVKVGPGYNPTGFLK